MELSDTPHRNPDYPIERVDEDVLASHPHAERSLKFNETAALIWDLCDGKRTVQEISRLLTETYPDQAAQIHADLASILRTLEETGCIGVS